MARTERREEVSDAPRGGNVSHIGNKAKRQEVYAKYRKEKAKQKLQRRLALAKDERRSKDGQARMKVCATGVWELTAGTTFGE